MPITFGHSSPPVSPAPGEEEVESDGIFCAMSSHSACSLPAPPAETGSRGFKGVMHALKRAASVRGPSLVASSAGAEAKVVGGGVGVYRRSQRESSFNAREDERRKELMSNRIDETQDTGAMGLGCVSSELSLSYAEALGMPCSDSSFDLKDLSLSARSESPMGPVAACMKDIGAPGSLLEFIKPSVHGNLYKRGKVSGKWRPTDEYFELRGSLLMKFKSGSGARSLGRRALRALSRPGSGASPKWSNIYLLQGCVTVAREPFRDGSTGELRYPFDVVLCAPLLDSNSSSSPAGLDSSSSNRTLYLAATSAHSRDSWMGCIKAASVVDGRENYTLRAVIGEGHFGKVLLAEKKAPGQGGNDLPSPSSPSLVALKEIQLHRYTDLQTALAERKVLSVLPEHPFVITMRSAFSEGKFLYYTFDFMPGADLFEHIRRQDIRVDRFSASYYVGQIALALEHLHSHGIIYRDLKPENVLVDRNGNLKLADVGLSKFLAPGEKAFTQCGTRAYLSPEMLLRTGYAAEADFWQLGCFMYELYVGHSPFWAPVKKGEDPMDGPAALILAGRFNCPKIMDDEAVSLVCGLLSRYMSDRLGVNGWEPVKTHPFFEGIEWTALLEGRQLREAPHVPDDPGIDFVGNFDTHYTSRSPSWGCHDSDCSPGLSAMFQAELLGFSWVRDEALVVQQLAAADPPQPSKLSASHSAAVEEKNSELPSRRDMVSQASTVSLSMSSEYAGRS